jgi:hypothetical protein
MAGQGWWYTLHPGTWDAEVAEHCKASPGKSTKPYLKSKLEAKGWGMVQVVDDLLSKQALNSIPSTKKMQT